jgi:uncharacterized protein YbjT (DUF2867 family)
MQIRAAGIKIHSGKRRKPLTYQYWNMKILVAGNGFIGRNAVEELRENHLVKTLDRGNGTYQQDIMEKFSIEEEFDVMIHTIGLAPGMHSEKAYREVHAEGTRNLLKGVKAEKIVYLSALGAGEIDHSFFRTKKKAEKLIKNSESDHTILRPSTVYGEGNKLLELMRKAAPTRVFPNIKTRTQPIHIEDLVEIISRSVEEFSAEILELGGPEKMTAGELARKIYREEGYSCTLIPLPRLLQKTGLTLLDPFPGPFNRENIRLLENQNTTDRNDAEKILGELKKI